MGPRRLHPALLVHTTWVAGRRRLVAQASSARPPLIVNSPLALSALGALPNQFDRASASAAWRDAGVPDDAHEPLWTGFEAAGLFADPPRNGPAWWDELEWREARAYHHATRDYPFLQMDQRGAFARDAERMDDYRSESPAPSLYQHVDNDGTVELPRLSADESPDERLSRMPDDDRRGRDGIGLLLDVCFGERGQMKVAGHTRCLLKSIPSGGARHPTEVFLGAFDVPGVAAGVYHYDVEHHRLERVRGGQHRDAFAHATLDLFAKHASPPAAALVFTSRVERSMWRYRDPRSFRAILVDTGHAVMAYRHVARTLGFRTYALQKMHDSEVADLVGVDRVVQPPLYVGTLVP
jgi:SagB-type dehydrogenase family enzyme